MSRKVASTGFRCSSPIPTSLPPLRHIHASNTFRRRSNGFFAILTVLVCILNWSSLAFLRKFCERCHEATIETGECYGKDLDTYEDYCKGGTLDAYERACITSTIISVPLTVLYVLGFYYGRDLWSRADVIFVVADGGGEGGGGFMDGYDVEMTTPQFQGEVGGDGEEDMRGKL
mmetsp:Transcript_10451/g.20753  ORF Transcript_10451/g.20753 Transcript_10451/m.20753 type:complete len:174 (+) Transcript_10451:621-1142(+)